MIPFFIIMTEKALDSCGPAGDFERLGRSNGGRFWYARDFMAVLGYESFPAFQKAINKAIGTCTTLEIPVVENFMQVERDVEGVPCADYKLTRFACYLIAMNGDTGKQQVAAAQAYFAGMAEVVRRIIEDSENVERVQIRDEITGREKSLGGVAKSAGVVSERYGLFQNAGYRGMYNMDYARLRAYKGVDASRSLLDFMGKQELAANLFRITETEAKIRKEGVRGQFALETAAEGVGRRVRNTMIETSGTYPEQLPITDDIRTVRSGLKKAHREFKKIDKPKKRLIPPSKPAI